MEILNATFQLSECYHFLYCQKYKTKCDLNFKYGNINEYLNQDYEKLEKKATKYINELKNEIEKNGNNELKSKIFNDYYYLVCNWLKDTNAKLFQILKKIFYDIHK